RGHARRLQEGAAVGAGRLDLDPCPHSMVASTEAIGAGAHRAVAGDAGVHVEVHLLTHAVHAADRAVAGLALDAGGDVGLVGEAHVVGHPGDALPGDGG